MPAPFPTNPPQAGQFGPDVYATWRASSLGEITETLEHGVIFRLAGALQGCSLLDIGCGDGPLVLLSVDRGAAHVTGCDPDPRMIARARAKSSDRDARIDFLVARSQFAVRGLQLQCRDVHYRARICQRRRCRHPGVGTRAPPRRAPGNWRSGPMEPMGRAAAHSRLAWRGPLANSQISHGNWYYPGFVEC